MEDIMSDCSAAEMGCTNAEHPDSYGHYREAIVTAIKHHWWWKVSFDDSMSFMKYVHV